MQSKCKNNAVGTKLFVGISAKPGEREARDIARQFEWRGKLDGIHSSLLEIDREIQSSSENRRDKRTDIDLSDGFSIVREMEKAAQDPSPEEIVSQRLRLRKKVESALTILKDPVKEKKAFKTPVVSNEWSRFEEIENERKQFIEAAYRRFRIAPVVAPDPPLNTIFDYESAAFTLPNGEKVTQPIASIKMNPGTHELQRKTDSGSASMGAPPADAECNIDRESFISSLILKSAKDPLTLNPGQEVTVLYYGISFPGIVSKRNIGSGTFTIRFDDGTTNDFPLHAICIK